MSETAAERRARTVDAQEANRQERTYYSQATERLERVFVDAEVGADYADLAEYVAAQ